MADKHFEQQVHDRMEEFKISPSAPVWMNIEAQLRKDKRRRWFFLLLFTGVLLSVGSLVYFNNRSSVQTPVVLQESKPHPVSDEPPTISSIISDTPEPVNHSNQSSTNTQPTVESQEPVIQLPQQTLTVVKTKGQTVSTPVKEITQQLTDEIVSKKPVAAEVVTQKQTVIPMTKLEQNATENNVTDSSTLTISKDAEANVIENKKETVADTTAIATQKPFVTIKPNKKWQLGWQINGGTTDVKEQLFATGKNFIVDNSYSVSLIGSTPTTSVSAVVINDYKVKANTQLGAGLLLRKPLNKLTLFATGLQYQYNSFTVVNRQRVDTYSQQLGRFSTISQNEIVNTYRFHYLTIPTEVQWQLLKAKNSSLRLGTGIHHSLRVGSSDSLAVFASGNKAAVYQPVISIVPAFEWNTKKASMQLGWYFNYGLTPVYTNAGSNHWRQTGLRFQYYFPSKK